MRRLLAVGVLLLPLSSLAAQSKIQIIAGVSSAKVAESSEGATVTLASRTGFAGGIGIVNRIVKGVDFAPEILYVQKGFDQTDSGDELVGKLGYIEIPILLRAAIGEQAIHPFVYGGPSVAVKVSCKLEGTSEGVTVSEDCTTANIDVKSLDYGVTIGAGLQLHNLGLSVRYDLGLANISNDTGAGESVKNRAWLFLASLTLK